MPTKTTRARVARQAPNPRMKSRVALKTSTAVGPDAGSVVAHVHPTKIEIFVGGKFHDRIANGPVGSYAGQEAAQEIEILRRMAGAENFSLVQYDAQGREVAFAS